MVRPRPGRRGGMGLLLPGRNRATETKDVGNSEEEFALLGEERKINFN